MEHPRERARAVAGNGGGHARVLGIHCHSTEDNDDDRQPIGRRRHTRHVLASDVGEHCRGEWWRSRRKGADEDRDASGADRAGVVVGVHLSAESGPSSGGLAWQWSPLPEE